MILSKKPACKFFSLARYASVCGWEVGLNALPNHYQLRWQRSDDDHCVGVLAFDKAIEPYSLLEQLVLVFGELPEGVSSEVVEALLPQEQISPDLIKNVWADFVCFKICQ